MKDRIKNIREQVCKYLCDNELSYDRASKEMRIASATLKSLVNERAKPSIRTLSRLENFLEGKGTEYGKDKDSPA